MLEKRQMKYKRQGKKKMNCTQQQEFVVSRQQQSSSRQTMTFKTVLTYKPYIESISWLCET